MIKRGSEDWLALIDRLNYSKSKSNRDVLCSKCWKILKYEAAIRHRNKHPEHNSFVMTSKEFATEKKFIHVAKYYGKCQVRKDETPVAEYFQNPFNPNDRRIRIERIQESFPQFIITRPNKEPLTTQIGQLQEEKEDYAIDFNFNSQSNCNQKSEKTEFSTQDQDKKLTNGELIDYITKLEENIELLTKQVRDFLQKNKQLEECILSSRPNCYGDGYPQISQFFQNNQQPHNLNTHPRYGTLQSVDQLNSKHDQQAISSNIGSNQVPQIQSSNGGKIQYQQLQQLQQNKFQYDYPQPSQFQISNNPVQARIQNHFLNSQIETSQKSQMDEQKMGQFSQKYFLPRQSNILQPFNSHLIHQVPPIFQCGIQILRSSTQLSRDNKYQQN
eukprot:403365529